MKHRYLITGASGFIGANIVQRLLKENTEVHVLVRPKSNTSKLSAILTQIQTHTISVDDSQTLEKVLLDIHPEYIFHLASYGNNSAQTDVAQMVQSNIQFSTNLLLAAQTIPYKAFVLTGSSSEYGFKTKAMSETDILEPASFYAATKAGITHIAQVFRKLYNKPIVVVRPFSVYGPYEDASRLVPTVIKKCLAQEDIMLTPGTEKRDFIYVDDFVEGFFRVANAPEKLPDGLVNIGSGHEYTTKEMVTTIHQLTQSNSKLLWGTYPNRKWDTEFWKADMRRMVDYYQWQPHTSLSQGISKTIHWMKDHHQLYDI